MIVGTLGGLGGQGIRGTAPTLPFYTETVSFQSSITTNSGTISGSSLQIVDTFIRSMKANSLWSKVLYMWLPVGNFAASMVPLVVGTASGNIVNTSFVSSDYAENTGLTGNGSTKCLNTLYLFPGNATGGLGVYLRTTASSSNTRTVMGCTDGTNRYNLQQLNTPTYAGAFGLTTSTTNVNGVMPAGVYNLDRSGSTLLTLYYNGSSVSTKTTSITPGSSTRSLHLFALNNSGAINQFWDASLGGAWVMNTMTAGENATFSTIMQTFQTALGR